MKEIIQKYKIIKSKRQPNNLKRLLTKAKFTDTQELPKILKCNRPNCGVCEHLITENKLLYFNAEKHLMSKPLCHVRSETLSMSFDVAGVRKSTQGRQATPSVTG